MKSNTFFCLVLVILVLFQDQRMFADAVAMETGSGSGLESPLTEEAEFQGVFAKSSSSMDKSFDFKGKEAIASVDKEERCVNMSTGSLEQIKKRCKAFSQNQGCKYAKLTCKPPTGDNKIKCICCCSCKGADEFPVLAGFKI